MYDRFDQQMDVGVNFRMSEINALLSYAVMKETESIITNGLKLDVYPSIQKVENIGRKSEVFLTLSKGKVKNCSQKYKTRLY